MIKKFFLFVCLALLATGAYAQNETVTNQTVLDLLKEGFTSEEIMGQ